MTRPASTLASRCKVYEMAALGDLLGFPEIDGCTITGATAADMAITRRADGVFLRSVLRTAQVSL